MEKIIRIDDKDVTFKANAATPRRYRAQFGRDLLVDIQAIIDEAGKGKALSPEALNNFEDFAFTMAKQADESLPATPDEWLEGFGIFSIYNILPKLVELWTESTRTTSSSKKKA